MDLFIIYRLQAVISDPFVSLVDPIVSQGTTAVNLVKIFAQAGLILLFVYTVYKLAVGSGKTAVITLGIGFIIYQIVVQIMSLL